jgi:hypothetical protein
MKKIIAATAIAMMAGIASADFAITWLSNQGPVIKNGGTIAGPYAENGNLVQLIWTASAPVFGDSKADVNGGLAAGEFLLQSTVTKDGYGFFQSLVGTVTYGNAVVGGSNINSGYVFTRIFDSAAPAAGEWYVDTGLINTSAWTYDPTNVNTVYAANVVSGSGLVISSNNTQVIPEPGTIGMMGIAGIGMFLARKKARR